MARLIVPNKTITNQLRRLGQDGNEREIVDSAIAIAGPNNIYGLFPFLSLNSMREYYGIFSYDSSSHISDIADCRAYLEAEIDPVLIPEVQAACSSLLMYNILPDTFLSEELYVSRVCDRPHNSYICHPRIKISAEGWKQCLETMRIEAYLALTFTDLSLLSAEQICSSKKFKRFISTNRLTADHATPEMVAHIAANPTAWKICKNKKFNDAVAAHAEIPDEHKALFAPKEAVKKPVMPKTVEAICDAIKNGVTPARISVANLRNPEIMNY
jgi:hypothetical protein